MGIVIGILVLSLLMVLHELGHGLGFLGAGSVTGGLGYNLFSGYPLIYDRFVENGAGTGIMTFANGSAALAIELQGNSLYWNGAQGIAGERVTVSFEEPNTLVLTPSAAKPELVP